MPQSTPLSADAFADAFASAGRTLWCVAVGVLGRREGADDVVQEAAIVALNKLGDFDPATSFTAWMSQIVRFTALNHARRRKRSPLAGVEPEALAAMATAAPRSPDAPLRAAGALLDDQAAFDDEVVAALDTLDPTARACLLLRTVVDLPYRDIARALDVPEGTAMSHVHRARRTMRTRLEAAGTDAEGPNRAPAGSEIIS